MTVLKQSNKNTDLEVNMVQSKSDKIIIHKGKRDECSGNNEKINLKMFKIFEDIEKIISLKSGEFFSFDLKCLKFAVLLLTLCSGPKVNSGMIRDDEDLGHCLLGSFTQVQSWVQEDGTLSHNLNNSLRMDLSFDPDKVNELRLMLIYSTVRRPAGLDWPDSSVGSGGEAVPLNPDTLDRDQFGNLDLIYPELFDPDWEPPFTLDNLENVVFLSLARNGLDRIPLFYLNRNGTSTVHFRELRFLSFYGNSFGSSAAVERSSSEYIVMLNATDFTEVANMEANYGNTMTGKTNWVGDLQNLKMPQLLELDLRNCSIYIVEPDTFVSLPNLRRLYLSHNKIYQISDRAFLGLHMLVHLDLSYNSIPDETEKYPEVVDGMSIAIKVFHPLIRLISLDFSFTKLVQTSAKAFGQLGSTIERLSVCHTKFPGINKGLFANTTMKYLDISGNFALDVLGNDAFKGIEESLEILFANRLGIHKINFIENLTELKILSMTNNDITTVEYTHLSKLQNLMILDLNNNRIGNWNTPVFSDLNHLQMVRMASNSFNIMTTVMLEDLKFIRFFSLADNGFVCNCYLKGFVAQAMRNGLSSLEEELELYPDWYSNVSASDITYSPERTYEKVSESIAFQNAFNYYSRVLDSRNKHFVHLNDSKHYDLLYHSTPEKDALEDVTPDLENLFNFTTTILDYVDETYLCTDYKSNNPAGYYDISDCEKKGTREEDSEVNRTAFLVVFLAIMALFIFLGALAFWKRWYIRYFFMMLKNAAVLSVVGKETLINDAEKVFTYDVFVSYCDEDRPWVLEQLLPEVENNTPVSVCLHERDFQVGLSILENIISCMDRSRTLMMVVSNQFLQSHWCQFEMHLAQHRLLETRREQLILVLLEDIPRSKRPTTLHYLMMTKTYIVWPKNPSEQGVFWKRLRKALVYGKKLASERTSFA